MTDGMGEQMQMFDRDTWCGKTSPVPSAQTAERTSESSSKKRSKSSTPKFLFLDLTRENGLTQVASWEMGTASLGECLTLNIGESPNAVVESHLSQILEARVPLTYFLSDTACQGILRRSANRGKQLPEILDTALRFQIGWYPLAKKYFDERGIALKDAYIDMLPSEVIGLNILQDPIYQLDKVPCLTAGSSNGTASLGCVVGFDAYNQSLSGGKAITLRGSRGDNEHMPCVVGFYDVAVDVPADKPCSWDGGQVSPTLTKQNAGVEHTYCIQGNCIDRADTAGCNGRGWTEGVSYTLNTVDRHAVCSSEAIVEVWNGKLDGAEGNGISFSVVGDHDNRPTDMTNALCIAYGLDRASFNQGANAKFDFAVEEDLAPTVLAKGPGAVCEPIENIPYQDTVGALCAADDKGAGNQYVEEGKCILLKKGFFSAVRRLMPTECERLQGFPYGWTDIGEWTDIKGKKRKTSDANRYKALGNSIALPSWRWLLGRLCENYDRPATMASLFDGIGGFPLIWEEINGKGTAVWASEIEEFPIAVTKERIGE